MKSKMASSEGDDLKKTSVSEENSDKSSKQPQSKTKSDWERFMNTVFGRMFNKI
jgi:hypothetical protein